jgi:hypothetical protein
MAEEQQWLKVRFLLTQNMIKFTKKDASVCRSLYWPEEGLQIGG